MEYENTTNREEVKPIMAEFIKIVDDQGNTVMSSRGTTIKNEDHNDQQ